MDANRSQRITDLVAKLKNEIFELSKELENEALALLTSAQELTLGLKHTEGGTRPVQLLRFLKSREGEICTYNMIWVNVWRKPWKNPSLHKLRVQNVVRRATTLVGKGVIQNERNQGYIYTSCKD